MYLSISPSLPPFLHPSIFVNPSVNFKIIYVYFIIDNMSTCSMSLSDDIIHANINISFKN